MASSSVYFVGTPEEVAHHAEPLTGQLDVAIAGPGDVVDRAQPGDVAIFYSEHFDRFRDSCQRLMKKQVATLYMIDGILEWRNAWVNRADEVACPYTMRPVLAHKVACIGDAQARVLNSWDNVGKTEVVGIPRLDRYPILSNSSVDQTENGEFRLLVMTAKTPGFTPEQIETTTESLRDLKSQFEQNPTIDNRKLTVTWRLTGSLAEQVGVPTRLNDLTGRDLACELEKVDAVITTPSTAMLEAMKFGLPVALLDYHNCPHYVPAAWRISSREHIAQVMTQLVNPPARRMLYQDSILKDNLQAAVPATERMIELISEMQTIARQQIDSGQALKFPSSVLPPLPSESNSFVHREIFPQAEEFQINDEVRLQVELSHARREVEHLQRELLQVRSELGQAHKIFEEIESHPIAGPIVKIRRRLLAWAGWLLGQDKTTTVNNHPNHTPLPNRANQIRRP